jgi:branched-chain amino acid transport system ATP-binding protein
MIASALATRPRLMMLDEPVGGLNISETDLMVDLIRKIHSDTGAAIIIIEHVMRFLVALSTRVMVMNQGSKLFEGTAQDMAADENVVNVYLGRKAATALKDNLRDRANVRCD